MKNEKKKILEKIKEIKAGYSQDDQPLRNAINPFYKQLIIQKRDLRSFFKDQKILQHNLLDDNKKLAVKITEFTASIEKYNKIYKEYQTHLDFIQKKKEDFNSLLEKDADKAYTTFCDKITQFWTKLSGINDKEILVKNNHLFLYSTSKNYASNGVKITTLSHKQKRLSRSQLELLRYSIQLALIYGIHYKFTTIPIKTIIIDDPNQKYIDEIVNLFKNVFIQDLGFQIIILTNINQKYPWSVKNFDSFKGNLLIFTQEYKNNRNKWNNGVL